MIDVTLQSLRNITDPMYCVEHDYVFIFFICMYT